MEKEHLILYYIIHVLYIHRFSSIILIINNIMDPGSSAAQGDSKVLASQIYDQIMGGIEPELLLSNIPLLEKKYENESKEQHEIRMQRYADAYKKFQEAFASFKTVVGGSIKAAKKEDLTKKEQASFLSDQQALESIVAEF